MFDEEGKAILAAVHSAVNLYFEPPVPTGELLGQCGYTVVVRKTIRDSLREMLDKLYRIFEQAYNNNKIDLIYWKDIQTRFKSLEHIQDDTHAEFKFGLICNTLGAKRACLVLTSADTWVPHNCRRSQEFDICITSNTRHTLLYSLMQMPAAAVRYIQNRSYSLRDYLKVEHFIYTYMSALDIVEPEWKAAIEDKHHPRILTTEALLPEKVLKGFSGFWESRDYLRGLERKDIISQYTDCLETDAPDYPIEEDDIWVVPITYDVCALFDKDGPYDITSEAYD